MTKFENLIKYLPLLEDDNIGTWIIDRENDGTSDHPIQMPFVNYSEMVHHFIEDVYAGENVNYAIEKSIENVIDEIIALRKTARDNKDWAKSDEIRDKLLAHKIQLKDTKNGTTWQII